MKSKGNTIHEKILRVKVSIGAIRNIIKFEELGIIVSLPINLKPSAKACKRPKIPVTLGPLLRCIEANTFLSNRVKKAIDNIMGSIKGKNLNQFKSKFNIR